MWKKWKGEKGEKKIKKKGGNVLLYLRFPVFPGASECASVRDLALFSFHAFKGKFVTEPCFCTSVISFYFFFFLEHCSFYFFIKLHPLLKIFIQISIYNLFTGSSHLSSIRSLHLAAGSPPFPTALLPFFSPPFQKLPVVFLAFRLILA